MRLPSYLEADFSREQRQVEEMLEIVEREARQMDCGLVDTRNGVDSRTCIECGAPLVNGKCVSLDPIERNMQVLGTQLHRGRDD